MAELLPGAPVAERLTQDLKARSDVLRQRGVTPTLAIIRVGRDPGGLAYEKGAASRCAKCGIDLRRIHLDDAASLPEVIRAVNDDPAIHGCLLLRPLADKAAEEAAGRLLSPDKDVDGMTAAGMGGLMTVERNGFAPCTAAACMEMLRHYHIPLRGKNVTVVGTGRTVGMPLLLLLIQEDATAGAADGAVPHGGHHHLCRRVCRGHRPGTPGPGPDHCGYRPEPRAGRRIAGGRGF